MSEKQKAKKALIKILQGAYSGEKAAAFAYRGHWKSVKNTAEKQAIKQIEDDEWHHRKIVLEMLHELGAKPKIWREIVFGTIGRTLGFFCFLSGWFFPMFFAGRLETQNVNEYDTAVKLARTLGLTEMALCLEDMSDKELEHEEFFYEIIKEHKFLPLISKIYRLQPAYKNSKKTK